MESRVRNVRELAAGERRVYEAALGHKLQENQQVILQVITLSAEQPSPPSSDEQAAPPSGRLPDWCNVYEGLSDEEIEQIETVIPDRGRK